MQIIWPHAWSSSPERERNPNLRAATLPSSRNTPHRLAAMATDHDNKYMHKLGCVPRSHTNCGVKRVRSWPILQGLGGSIWSLLLLLAPPAFAGGTAGSEQKPATPLTFERDVRPILRAHCLDCHGSQNVRKGGLDMRLRRLMVKGGESGPAISPSHPEDSYLLDRVRTGEMPPGDQKLTSAEGATLEKLIRAGAATAQSEPA